MATVTTDSLSSSTVFDLLESLGGIPARRVRLRPAPGTATERDVLTIHSRENRLFELVDGVLVEKAIGYLESSIAAVLIKLIGYYLDEHDLGVVAGEAGMLRIGTGLVRIPDVSFVSWDRLPGRRIPRKPIPNLVPDLAVEVISRGNTRREMARKLSEYFGAGVRLVWLVYPKSKAIEVYTGLDACRTLRIKDTLDGGDVLPGFSMPVRKLFERASR